MGRREAEEAKVRRGKQEEEDQRMGMCLSRDQRASVECRIRDHRAGYAHPYVRTCVTYSANPPPPIFDHLLFFFFSSLFFFSCGLVSDQKEREGGGAENLEGVRERQVERWSAAWLV